MYQRNREKVCKCCGKHYLYCYHCDSDKNKPTWMTMFHDENCLKIFYAVTDYNVGEKTKEEAKKVLESCNLTNKNNFVKEIKVKINEIMDIKSVADAADYITTDPDHSSTELESSDVNVQNLVADNVVADNSEISVDNNTKNTNNKQYKSSKKHQYKYR